MTGKSEDILLGIGFVVFLVVMVLGIVLQHS